MYEHGGNVREKGYPFAWRVLALLWILAHGSKQSGLGNGIGAGVEHVYAIYQILVLDVFLPQVRRLEERKGGCEIV